MANGKRKRIVVKMDAYLAHSRLMKYELFSEKPEAEKHGGEICWKILQGFNVNPHALYLHPAIRINPKHRLRMSGKSIQKVHLFLIITPANESKEKVKENL